LAVGILLATAPGAFAAPGDVTLASTADDGTKGDSDSVDASLSADGAAVAFTSFATNLDAGDTDDLSDVYLKDLPTGDLKLASTAGDGTKGNASSFDPSLSSDGTAVAFDSFATNLDAADQDAFADIYVKDLGTGNLVLASTATDGTKGNGDSIIPSLSADGRKVGFLSSSTNLDPADTDPTWDVYVKDVATGAISLASTADDGTKADADSSDPSLSAHGTRVAFWSYAANLDPADTDTVADLYVKDLVSGDIALASTTAGGTKGDGDSSSPSLSADGMTVAFFSHATDLDPADPDAGADVYVKDLTTGQLMLASTSDDGTKGDGDSASPSLSADGSTVAFHSNASNLDPGHTDHSLDVYVKDLATGELVLASSPDGVRPSISANGAFVAFESTSTTLDPNDTDSLADVYVRELPGAPVSADLGVSVTDEPDPVAAGQVVTYDVVVTNHGPSPATEVVLADSIADAGKLWSVTAAAGTCQVDVKLGTVGCALGSLAVGQSITVRLEVKAIRPKSGHIIETASVSGGEPDPVTGNDTASATTTIS
jgi:uncharacterized repeat protein (TIGR01451 family)